MAKRVVDITEKLNFEENPRLKIKGEEFEVNSDAFAMLKVMQFVGNDNPSGADIVEAFETLFEEKERQRLGKLGLKLNDFIQVIESAVNLVMGETETTGES